MARTIILCPVYNEKSSIVNFISSVLRYIDKDVHLLILEDYSDDGTEQICSFINNNLNFYFRDKLFFLFSEYNLGYGENLFRGFRWALERNYDFILTIDCDFQHLPNYIPMFLSLARKYDFVTGTRYSFNSLKLSEKSFYRYLINKKMSELINYLYKVRITDFFCGFRIYRRKLLGYIYDRMESYKNIKGISFSYDFPIYIWVDLLSFTKNIFELPIPFIFFDSRDFKGSNTEGIKNHFQRMEKYFEIFREYYLR